MNRILLILMLLCISYFLLAQDSPVSPLDLGDIIIDTTIADEQKENRTLILELQELFLHGLLHLLGYDHLSAAQDAIMKEKEEIYSIKLKENI